MILRIWTTGVVKGREADYLTFAQARSRDMFLRQEGCLGVLFVTLQDGRHAACSFWRDSDVIDRLTASDDYRATAAALGSTGVLEGPQEVRLYEIEGGAFDPAAFAAAAPPALRIG